jgi:hypothetical protein
MRDAAVWLWRVAEADPARFVALADRYVDAWAADPWLVGKRVTYPVKAFAARLPALHDADAHAAEDGRKATREANRAAAVAAHHRDIDRRATLADAPEPAPMPDALRAFLGAAAPSPASRQPSTPAPLGALLGGLDPHRPGGPLGPPLDLDARRRELARQREQLEADALAAREAAK